MLLCLLLYAEYKVRELAVAYIVELNIILKVPENLH